MTKWILMALLLAPLAARAELVKVSAWGGYTTVKMDDFTASIDSLAKSLTGTVTTKNNGWIIGGDANIVAAPFFMYGLRIEYLHANLSDYSVAGQTTSWSASLIPIMAGLNFKFKMPATDFGFIAGVHGGYGAASIDASSPLGTGTGTAPSGGGFVGEVSSGFEFGVAPLVSLRVMAAYRYAPLDSLGTLPQMDFSGINAVGGLSIGF